MKLGKHLSFVISMTNLESIIFVLGVKGWQYFVGGFGGWEGGFGCESSGFESTNDILVQCRQVK